MILDAQHITKSYGSLQVLNGVSLQVQKGEVISIVGHQAQAKVPATHHRHTRQA
jgi:ABC-type histidine transport system ATPase subunit